MAHRAAEGHCWRSRADGQESQVAQLVAIAKRDQPVVEAHRGTREVARRYALVALSRDPRSLFLSSYELYQAGEQHLLCW